jgi:hypothetical protein
VDGRQGHDPGGTVDADSLRPIQSKRAVVIRTLPEFTRTADGFRLSAFLFGGRQAGGSSGGGATCAVTGGPAKADSTSKMCCGILFGWLTVMFALVNMSVGALHRAAAGGGFGYLRRSVDFRDGPGIQRSGFPDRNRGNSLADLRGAPLNWLSVKRHYAELKGARGLVKGGGSPLWTRSPCDSADTDFPLSFLARGGMIAAYPPSCCALWRDKSAAFRHSWSFAPRRRNAAGSRLRHLHARILRSCGTIPDTADESKSTASFLDCSISLPGAGLSRWLGALHVVVPSRACIG